MSNDDNEVLQRVRRIETKVMVLGNAMGVDMKQDRERIVVVDKTSVCVSQLDIPLSALHQFALVHNLASPFFVVFDGRLVATIHR